MFKSLLLQHQKTATLLSAGWFETTAHFSEPKGNGSTWTASGCEIS
jgi:hypothetical protein